MPAILVIEDDLLISNMLSEFLTQNGFEVSVAYTGTEGLVQAKTLQHDLILLDLMLPFQSGDEVLRQFRLVSDAPVIVLSAKSLVQNKIELFSLGADDYLTKPFDLGELLARIQVNLRRHHGKQTFVSPLNYGGFTLSPDAKEISFRDMKLDLTAKEYSILALLLSNPTKVFSKQNLYESIWEEAYAYDNDTINTHMSNLRKKLKDMGSPDPIETVWGMGYKLKSLEKLENSL
jgi:DNA-binding response OmpR family regulator